MFVDFDNPLACPAAGAPVRSPAPAGDWSILLPFFNEAEAIAATLQGIAVQSVPARVILIDNGSTDNGAAIARATCRRLRIDHELVVEHRPGKVAALAAGLARVRTRFVATCDADTWYPPHYLAAAGRVLEAGAAVAGAFYCAIDAQPASIRASARRVRRTAAVLRGQSHTGGAGQAFRTDALRRAGGFDAARWGWVLEDHEVIHRVLPHGPMRYAADLWCSPSPRPRDRASIRWTLAERLLYGVAAPVAGDWFFYRFLGPRLRARRLSSERIRERAFQHVGQPAG